MLDRFVMQAIFSMAKDSVESGQTAQFFDTDDGAPQ
jgi:hypothetical protein